MRKVRKVVANLLLLVMLISIIPISKATAVTIPPIRVTKIDLYTDITTAQVNFNSITLETPATLLNGKNVAPAKFIAETMGAIYNWNAGTQTINIVKGNTSIELQIGNAIAKLNGNNVTLDQAATLINGIPTVPAKFVAEALGGATEWNPNQNKFTITFTETLNSNQLKLPSFFANNMVIQRDLPIPVWGLAPTGSAVTVTLGSDTKTTTSQDGRWRVDLDAKVYGGPYTLLVSAGTTNLQYTNILIGDVFFCSGQSNMVVPLRNVTDGNVLALTANHPNMRYFDTAMTDSDTPAFEPLSDLKWQIITSTNATNLAAVAYLFARYVSEGLNNQIPIGIYHSAIGSTSITSWLPAEVNQELGAVQTTDMRRPSAFYNAMIAPFFPAGLKGVVWYQGESSINAVEIYSRQMSALMNDYRNKTNIPSLPIFYPQLPRFNLTSQPGKWAEMREMQQDARDHNENFYMGVNIDLGEAAAIHPADKVPLAQRLANLALKHLYNKTVIADAPFMKSNTIENNKIVIDFTNSEDGIIIRNVPNKGIEIAGENKVFVPANAQMVNNKLSVWADSISSPKYVRYAFSNYPDYSLFSNNGLPVAPFRNVAVDLPSNVVPDDLLLTPAADTLINGATGKGDLNYGKITSLNLHLTSTLRSLIRFDLPSNLNVNNVDNITLKLYATVPGTDIGKVFNVFKISNTTWEEGTGSSNAGTIATGSTPGITDNRAIDNSDLMNNIVNPDFTKPLVTSTGADGTTGLMVATIPTSAITQADVTAGAVSFILKGNLSNNWNVHSNEATDVGKRPKLEIVSSSPTASFSPAINGFVSSDNPSATLNSTTLRVQNRDKNITLLKFDVSGITKKVTSAKLTLKPSTLPVSSANINVYATEEMAGDGSSLSYTNMPHIWNMTTLASLSVTNSSTSPIVVDLSSVITKNGTYYLALKSNSSEVVEFSSSADSTIANRPNLVVEFDKNDTSEAVYTPKLYKSSYYKINGINVYNGNNAPASLTNEIRFKNETGNSYTFEPIVAAYKGAILEAVSIGQPNVTVNAGSVGSPYSSGVISITLTITKDFDTVKTFMWNDLEAIQPKFNYFINN